MGIVQARKSETGRVAQLREFKMRSCVESVSPLGREQNIGARIRRSAVREASGRPADRKMPITTGRRSAQPPTENLRDGSYRQPLWKRAGNSEPGTFRSGEKCWRDPQQSR